MNTVRDLSLSTAKALIRVHAEMTQHSPESPARPPYTVTISREAGALGNSVAKEVGRMLGDWPVYDKNLLEQLAEELHRHPSDLEDVDERPISWLEECLGSLFDKYRVGTDAYLKHLFAAVRGLGANGKCVIVGRGANFILPAETTLRVRLIATVADRSKEIAARLNLSTKDAENWVKTTERERVGFVKRTFNQDPADPIHYDLVLNMSRLSAQEAADIIVQLVRRRERQNVPAAAESAVAAKKERVMA